MASEKLRALYRECRKAGTCIVGEHAIASWRNARILRQWDALDWVGFVRMVAPPDESFDPGEIEDNRDREIALTYGVYGTVGQYTLNPDSANPDTDAGWEHADSVWGNIGYRDVLDWRENPYVIDVMAETIRQFKAAWKSHVRKVCPMCHGTGRA